MRAYENSITVNIHCCDEGEWTQDRINAEQFSEFCQVRQSPIGKNVDLTDLLRRIISQSSNFPGKVEPIFPFLDDDGRIGLVGQVVPDVPIAVPGAAVGAAVPAAVGRRWQHPLQV